MNLIERFPKYTPSRDYVSLMEEAEVLATRVDTDNRMLEVDVKLSDIVRREKLYELEDEVCQAYNLNRLRIYPKYPSNLFTIDCIEDIIKESYRRQTISRGFFSDYSFKYKDDKIEILIPFVKGGIDLLGGGRTDKILEDIIFEEFGIRKQIIISQRDDYEKMTANYENDMMEQLKRAIALGSQPAKTDKKVESAKKEAEIKEMRNAFKHSTSFSGESSKLTIDGSIVKSGALAFDVSEPIYVTGGIIVPEKIITTATIHIIQVDNFLLFVIYLTDSKQSASQPIAFAMA
jgi:hypothetical protein